MTPLVIATAGHIDHGKTALVRALTGVDTDRLPEEKKRGITIDLGFANLRVGDHSFGIVDVPGHEGFIRNMLAGATGMDAVLLIVAADEGVMPQTREHLAILDLLEVSCGLVVITKIDLVSREWLDLVVDDVSELLARTTLRAAPIIPVSAKTGEGIDELRNEIVGQAARKSARRADDLFRLPIDRVFTVSGTGTVVTGTVWSGSVHVDQSVTIRPSGAKVRIRGIEVHNAPATSARAGERAALALAGIDRESVARGEVALDSSGWSEVRMLVARLRVIPDTSWVIEPRQRLRIHLGTAEVLGRVVLLDAEILRPGDEGWVQIRLEEPVVARVGDRLVVRSYSPMTTIGGGAVAELSTQKRTALTSEDAERFGSVVAGTVSEAVVAALEIRGASGATVEELAIATPFSPDDVAIVLGESAGQTVRLGQQYFSSRVAADTAAALAAAVARMHEANPLRPTLERAELRSAVPNVPAILLEHLIDEAISEGRLIASGGSVAARGFVPVLTDRQATLRAAVLQAVKGADIAPPTVAELGRTLGDVREVQRLLRLLAHEGLVKAISQDLYMEVSALTAAEERTRAELAGANGLTAAEFRTALPVSRKHLIPLLEYFDKAGITVRDGDLRRVVPAPEKK